MKLLLALSYLVSASGMYALGQELGGEGAGWLAAILYVYFPYRLADIYTRGAIPEAIAFAIIPLVLWAWYKALQQGSRECYLITGAVAWASLVLTHSLATLLMAPLMALWVVTLVWQHRTGWKRLLKFIFALALGTVLGAFYWLPAWLEMNYVYIGAAGISRGYEKHLLGACTLFKPNFFYPYAPAGTVAIHPLPTVFVLIAIAGGITLFKVHPRIRPALLALGFALGWSILMRWQGALPLWRALELWLDVLQYPWRFLLLTAVSGSLLGGGAVYILKALCTRWGIPVQLAWLLPVLLLPSVALIRLPVRSLPLAPDDLNAEAMWQTDFNNRQIGATWTAEFVPIWVKADRTAIPLSRLPDEHYFYPPLKGMPSLSPERQRFLESRWRINTPQKVRLVWHQFYFPGWSVLIDGTEVPVEPVGPLGLLSWEVPPGEHKMVIVFRDTPIRKIAALLSLAALMVLLLWLAREAPIALKGAAVATGLIIILLELFLYPFRPATLPAPVFHNVADKAVLVGYETPARVKPGEEVRVTLYWLALDTMERDYKVFVHIFDPATGHIVAQHDGDPAGGFTPTTRWVPGEIVVDTHRIPVPSDVPPGRYILGVGLYEFATLRNLPVMGENFPGNRIPLAEVEVR